MKENLQQGIMHIRFQVIPQNQGQLLENPIRIYFERWLTPEIFLSHKIFHTIDLTVDLSMIRLKCKTSVDVFIITKHTMVYYDN